MLYAGKTFRSLPNGGHGKVENFEVELGIVKRMCKYFSIEKCAKSELPQLSGWRIPT